MFKKNWVYLLAAVLTCSFLATLCAQEYFEEEDQAETGTIAPKSGQAEKVSAQTGAVKKKKPKEQAKYVGVEECKKCHEKEYIDFKKRKFSKAWKILEMRGEVDNPKCLKCHATGYGQPSGFTSEDATPHLMYKQCEACHGPGSLHKRKPFDKEIRKDMRNYIRDKDVCIKCHVCMFTHKTGSF